MNTAEKKRKHLTCVSFDILPTEYVDRLNGLTDRTTTSGQLLFLLLSDKIFREVFGDNEYSKSNISN